MIAILLDTNAFLWLAKDPERLAESALSLVGNPVNDVFVSAASAWEVAIKTRMGRFDGAGLLSAWDETLAAMAIVGLPIDAADAIVAGQLNWEHRDPFDRMIVAQAARRGMTIATSDRTMQQALPTPVIDTRR